MAKVRLTAGLERLPTFTGLNPDQKYILELFRKPDHPMRFMWCNNWGTGKSATEYMLMIDWAMRYPGIHIWFGRAHIQHLYDNNMGLFWTIVPQDIWKYKIYGGRKPTEIVFPNKSVIQFVGFHDPSAKLGGNPGCAFLEEVSELDIEMYNYIEGRVGRQPGIDHRAAIIYGSGNPRGHYPLYRKFVKGEGIAEHERKNYLWFKGDPQGNKKNLPPGYYERLAATFPKELYERFVLGSDDTHAGQIYPEFNREIHVHHFTWQQHWIPYVGLDHGIVDPTAVPFVGYDPYTGDVYQIAEHYRTHTLVPEHCRIMHEIAESVQFPEKEYVGMADSNIMEMDGGTGKTIQDWFSEGGWNFTAAPKRGNLLPGIEKIKNLLLPANGVPPKLHIHPRCVKTIEEFWMYEWQTPKNPAEAMKFKEKPREDYNHMMDALRYVINAMPIAESRVGDKKLLSIWEQCDMVDEVGGGAIIWNEENQKMANLAKSRTPPSHPLLDS